MCIRDNMNDAAVLGKIFKRTIIIFLLGYLMYWFPFVHWNESGGLSANPIGHTRIMGVLQRIALGYCAAALMIRYLKLNTVSVSYTHLRAHETGRNLVCRLLL